MIRQSTFQRPLGSILLSLTLLAAACAPAQRLYSVDPVGPRGEAMPLESVVRMVFEDQQTRPIREGELLQFEAGRFIHLGRPDAEGQRPTREWDAGVVEGFEVEIERGELVWFDVKTPDDLSDFDPLPRLESITLRDGRRFDIEEQGMDAMWSADGLAIRVGMPADPLDDYETLSLDQVAHVQLHEPNIIDATLRSPMFWVAGAAAAGLFVILNQDAGDNDAVR